MSKSVYGNSLPFVIEIVVVTANTKVCFEINNPDHADRCDYEVRCCDGMNAAVYLHFKDDFEYVMNVNDFEFDID